MINKIDFKSDGYTVSLTCFSNSEYCAHLSCLFSDLDLSISDCGTYYYLDFKKNLSFVLTKSVFDNLENIFEAIYSGSYRQNLGLSQ